MMDSIVGGAFVGKAHDLPDSFLKAICLVMSSVW